VPLELVAHLVGEQSRELVFAVQAEYQPEGHVDVSPGQGVGEGPVLGEQAEGPVLAPGAGCEAASDGIDVCFELWVGQDSDAIGRGPVEESADHRSVGGVPGSGGRLCRPGPFPTIGASRTAAYREKGEGHRDQEPGHALVLRVRIPQTPRALTPGLASGAAFPCRRSCIRDSTAARRSVRSAAAGAAPRVARDPRPRAHPPVP